MDAREEVTLETLEARLTALLPQEYQDAYEDVEPVPMGSAGLKFGPDGKVAWNEIWQSFCDLAMAGGPPHKGLLLRPGRAEAIAAEPDRYNEVAQEICRGVTLATGLPADPSTSSGWIDVGCDSDGMTAWLLRAVTMENVSARADGTVLQLPAGPAYRLDKEIKNVVTVIAKTCHYWSGHMWRFEQRAIADLFAAMEAESPLLAPAADANLDAAEPPAQWVSVRQTLAAATELPVATFRYPDWIGVTCPSVRAAVWMMRMMVASNVLARRENTELLLPVNAAADPDGKALADRLSRVARFAAGKALL